MSEMLEEEPYSFDCESHNHLSIQQRLRMDDISSHQIPHTLSNKINQNRNYLLLYIQEIIETLHFSEFFSSAINRDYLLDLLNNYLEANRSLLDQELEELVTNPLLAGHEGTLRSLLKEMSNQFIENNIHFELPSIFHDKEEEDIELFWDNKEFSLVINIDYSGEIIAILTLYSRNRKYTFEIESNRENIVKQLVAVIKSTK